MPERKANASWEGTLKEGKGKVTFGSYAFQGAYSFDSRFKEGSGTNPEELLGAAHAACYSMALAAALAKAGFHPKQVNTKAKVHLDQSDAGFKITTIELRTQAIVPGIDEKEFLKHANTTKETCPVSKALAGPRIELNARLSSAGQAKKASE